MSYTRAEDTRPYGLLAEFDSAKRLVFAAQQAHASGYRRMDAYSPFPIDGLAEALGRDRTGIPVLVLIAGVFGGIAGYLLEYYCSVIDYPLNVGGRPVHTWPSFVPPAFETTILAAALMAVLGMIALNGLPRLYHPIFNVPQFERASQDRFFLCIESNDPQYAVDATRKFLEGLNSLEVTEVPA